MFGSTITASPRRALPLPGFLAASCVGGLLRARGIAGGLPASTSRCSLRSTPASGVHVMRANIWPVSRSSVATRATARPGGYVPSRPDVTSTSPTWMSADGAMKRSSGGRPAPAPKSTRAHAAALDLDRHRVILVGDERHFGHVRKHARHLPDHALARRSPLRPAGARRRCPCRRRASARTDRGPCRAPRPPSRPPR